MKKTGEGAAGENSGNGTFGNCLHELGERVRPAPSRHPCDGTGGDTDPRRARRCRGVVSGRAESGAGGQYNGATEAVLVSIPRWFD